MVRDDDYCKLYTLSFFDILYSISIDCIEYVLLDCTHYFDLFNQYIDSRGLRSHVCHNVKILCSVLIPMYIRKLGESSRYFCFC